MPGGVVAQYGFQTRVYLLDWPWEKLRIRVIASRSQDGHTFHAQGWRSRYIFIYFDFICLFVPEVFRAIEMVFIVYAVAALSPA